MIDPALTVIMSCYNQAEYIRQAIDSVLGQETDFPVRLLITDDCSTKDDSRNIIREYADRHPDRIEVLLNDTNGRYLANILRAKARTKSEFMTMLDADDFWTDPHYLQDAVDYLRTHGDYAVYFRNVTCLQEDGASKSFLTHEPWKTDFCFDDFLNGYVLIPQTTGAVFRNVVYRDGIPAIVSEAVGTIHERSYEGDVARYLMHLERGKAHYDPRLAGVYRVLSSGIWCRLPESMKHLIQAQFYLDSFAYFHKARKFFVNRAYRELIRALSLTADQIAGGKSPDETWVEYFKSVSAACASDSGLLRHEPEEAASEGVRAVLKRCAGELAQAVRRKFCGTEIG